MIEITSELFSLVAIESKHSWTYISYQKFNRINSNNLEEIEDDEKEPIDIEFIRQKADPYNGKIAFDFSWLDVQEKNEEDINLVSLIESLQKQADEESFQKSN